jgi:Beta-propeller repeat
MHTRRHIICFSSILVTTTHLLESPNRFQPNRLLGLINLFIASAALLVPGARAFAQAPPVLWTQQVSALNSTNTGRTGLSAVDGRGNIFFAGNFNLLVASVGSQTLTNLSINAGFGDPFQTLDVFVAKYNSAGGFLWARQIGGDSFDAVRATATDPAGNLLVMVVSRSTNIFSGMNTLATNAVAGTGAQSTVLVKFDPQGSFLWARQILGSSYEDTGTDMAVDGNGNIIETGTFASSNFFFGTNFLSNTNPAGSPDFMVKYDEAGNLLWVRKINLKEIDRPVLAVDGQGNACLFATFTGIADFGGVQLTNSSFNTVSLAKFDPDGNVLWARAVAASSNYIDPARAGVDAHGNCYLTGGYSANAVFQGATLPFVGEYGDVFVAKYDGSGNFVWANPITGNVEEFAAGLAVDPMGNSYATGENDSATLGIGAMTFTNAGPYFINGYVAKYDTAGNLLWAEILPLPTDGVPDSHGNLYGFGSIYVSTNGNPQPYVSYIATKISGPVVTIQPSGNQLVISWPTNAVGLNLESTADLLGVWSPITNVPVPVGNQFTVTNTLSDPARYYRLRNF